MELIIVITTLCISLSVLLTSCASQQIQVQSSHDQAQDLKVSLLALPRKLRVVEEAVTGKVNGDKEMVSYSKQRGTLSGKQHNKEADMKFGRGGTRQEWVEEGTGTDRSEFFTMDYSHVRRRRPIHNKSVPVGP